MKFLESHNFPGRVYSIARKDGQQWSPRGSTSPFRGRWRRINPRKRQQRWVRGLRGDPTKKRITEAKGVESFQEEG